MGQVPAKYLLPSAPYGSSDAVNAVNAVQPMAMNPQTPLLPPNFQGGGGMRPASPQSPGSNLGGAQGVNNQGQRWNNPNAMNTQGTNPFGIR